MGEVPRDCHAGKLRHLRGSRGGRRRAQLYGTILQVQLRLLLLFSYFYYLTFLSYILSFSPKNPFLDNQDRYSRQDRQASPFVQMIRQLEKEEPDGSMSQNKRFGAQLLRVKTMNRATFPPTRPSVDRPRHGLWPDARECRSHPTAATASTDRFFSSHRLTAWS